MNDVMKNEAGNGSVFVRVGDGYGQCCQGGGASNPCYSAHMAIGIHTLAQMLVCRVVREAAELVLHGLGQRRLVHM